LVASFFFFFCGGEEKLARCLTVDQLQLHAQNKLKLAGSPPSPIARFYLGHKWNPRIIGVDVKLFLYVIGAVGLQLVILSCAFHQSLQWGYFSLAMKVYIVCFGWFIVEYLVCEHVHLYTYDFFAEKIGFKLTWGCTVFYPFFYGIGAFSIASAPPGHDISPIGAGLTGLLFFTGWVITRGANLQKYSLRINPSSTSFLFGLVRQETLPVCRLKYTITFNQCVYH
jgi:delta14-sterol reductase